MNIALGARLVFPAVAVLLFTSCESSPPHQPKEPRARLASGKIFRLEIAQTDEERARGLMFRDDMKDDKGMLFIFEKEDIHSMWMLNMRFSIDILWLDEKGAVVWLYEDVSPCMRMPCPAYEPMVKARYVLELNAGTAKKNGLKVGSVIRLENIR